MTHEQYLRVCELLGGYTASCEIVLINRYENASEEFTQKYEQRRKDAGNALHSYLVNVVEGATV
jgi:hypothetical protein